MTWATRSSAALGSPLSFNRQATPSAMSHPRDFLFEGMEVGCFEDEMPRAAGRFRYMPYRGSGHHEMQMQRRAGNSPRCYYDVDDVRVSFNVCDCPEYGVLELCDFEISTRGAT